MSITSKLTQIKTNKSDLVAKLKSLNLGDGTQNLTEAVEIIKDIPTYDPSKITVKEGVSTRFEAGYYTAGSITGLSNDAADEEKYKTQAKTFIPTKEGATITPDAYQDGITDITAEGSVGVPITLGTLTGNSRAVTDCTPATITAMDNHSILNVIIGKLTSSDSSYGTSSLVATATISNDKKSCEISISGSVTGSGGTSDTITITVAYTVEYDTPYYALSSVTVAPIPAEYQNVSKVTATADTVLTGYTIVNKIGTEVDGAMTNNGAVNASIDGIVGDGEEDEGSLYYTIPKGYHDGTGKVTFDDSTILALLEEI